jgi:hypothetical protein
MKITGTLEYVDLEGGLWRLNADDGRRYTLLGSKAELKSARGARVEVEGSLDEGIGIGMSGPQLRVGRVRKL